MQKKRIGIGVGEDPQRVIRSILHYSCPSEIICYTDPDTALAVEFPCSVVVDESPAHRLIGDLVHNHLNAAVRGTITAHDTLTILKETCGISELERLVLMETSCGIRFFFGPVGIDEGWTIKQKVSLIKSGRKLAESFGLSPGVGILSGGRMGDVGRHPVVDRSLADAELIAQLTGCRHFEIRIEDAIKVCGLIIAPDGITGNLIFRTLLFAGNGITHGAPVLNINHIFVDTSRVNPDYSHALHLASSLIHS